MLILISFSTCAVYILKPNLKERHKISMDGIVGDRAEDSVFSTLSIYLTWHTQGTILYFPMSIFSSSFFEVNLNIIYLCLLARYTLLAPISASLDVGTDVVLAVPNNCLNFCKGQWKKIWSILILRKSSWFRLWLALCLASVKDLGCDFHAIKDDIDCHPHQPKGKIDFKLYSITNQVLWYGIIC